MYDDDNERVEQNSVPLQPSFVRTEEACLFGMDFDEEFEEPEQRSPPTDCGPNKKSGKQLLRSTDSLNCTPLRATVKSECPASWLAAKETSVVPNLDVKWEDDADIQLFPIADGTSVHFYWYDAYEDMRLQPGNGIASVHTKVCSFRALKSDWSLLFPFDCFMHTFQAVTLLVEFSKLVITSHFLVNCFGVMKA